MGIILEPVRECCWVRASLVGTLAPQTKILLLQCYQTVSSIKCIVSQVLMHCYKVQDNTRTNSIVRVSEVSSHMLMHWLKEQGLISAKQIEQFRKEIKKDIETGLKVAGEEPEVSADHEIW